jgi:hypothetical protein
MIHWRIKLVYVAAAALAILASVGGDLLSSYW